MLALDVLEKFKEDFPVSFLVDVREAVYLAYRQSAETVRNQGLSEAEQRNLLPWQRRAKIESLLRDAAVKANTCVRQETENSGFWNHLVISCGRFRLTQSATSGPDVPLRPADYKRQYAAEQLLFEFAQEGADGSDGSGRGPSLYAVVLHHAAFEADEPDFVFVRFPSPDLKSYHPAMLDLSLLGGAETPKFVAPVEEIEQIPDLNLKTARRAGNQ